MVRKKIWVGVFFFTCLSILEIVKTYVIIVIYAFIHSFLINGVMTVGVRCSVLTFDPRIFVVGQSTFYKGTLVPQRNIIFQNNFCMDSLVYSFYSIFCVRSLLTKNG